ncbi:MAG: Ku protein [Candidatus Sumerlaeaceae bacterium]
MAPRALWKGAINFGLIHIPVRMYKAASGKDIRFRELHDADMSPLKQKRVCARDGKEVSREHVVKGFEVSPDHFVIIKPEELDALEKAEPHTITIENFVEMEQVDPVYFENSYYVVPDKNAARAYALLLAAMEEKDKAAVARVVLRQKQQLVLLRSTENVMTLSTLYYADEVVSKDTLEGVPDRASPDKRELDMATRLIESLSDDFQPEKYHDEYREKLLALIDAKAEGEKWTPPKAHRETAKIVDLVSALQASLNATKKGSTTATPKRATAKSGKRTSRAAKHHATRKRTAA